jgi:hypothetical protein
MTQGRYPAGYDGPKHIHKHPNRINARKKKQGSGCKMCKPWKGKWEHKFKTRERLGKLNLNGMEFEVYQDTITKIKVKEKK